MAGTKIGGKKCAETNIEKFGKDFYQKMGAIGGSKRTENTKKKGFGSNRELARLAGKRGGRVSRRSKES